MQAMPIVGHTVVTDGHLIAWLTHGPRRDGQIVAIDGQLTFVGQIVAIDGQLTFVGQIVAIDGQLTCVGQMFVIDGQLTCVGQIAVIEGQLSFVGQTSVMDGQLKRVGQASTWLGQKACTEGHATRLRHGPAIEIGGVGTGPPGPPSGPAGLVASSSSVISPPRNPAWTSCVSVRTCLSDVELTTQMLEPLVSGSVSACWMSVSGISTYSLSEGSR
jgi:hypothetical protein